MALVLIPKSSQSPPKVIWKSSQSHSKVIPKSFQSRPRIDPGSTQDRPKIDPKSTPNRPPKTSNWIHSGSRFLHMAQIGGRVTSTIPRIHMDPFSAHMDPWRPQIGPFPCFRPSSQLLALWLPYWPLWIPIGPCGSLLPHWSHKHRGRFRRRFGRRWLGPKSAGFSSVSLRHSLGNISADPLGSSGQ